VVGEITVCFGSDTERALELAAELWPNAGIPGELSAELPLPRHFEQAGSRWSRDLRDTVQRARSRAQS